MFPDYVQVCYQEYLLYSNPKSGKMSVFYGFLAHYDVIITLIIRIYLYSKGENYDNTAR